MEALGAVIRLVLTGLIIFGVIVAGKLLCETAYPAIKHFMGFD